MDGGFKAKPANSPSILVRVLTTISASLPNMDHTVQQKLMHRQIKWPQESLDSALPHALVGYLLDHQMLGERVLKEQKKGLSRTQLTGRWIIAAAKLITVVGHGVFQTHRQKTAFLLGPNGS